MRGPDALELSATFRQEEAWGVRISSIGRFVVLGAIGIWVLLNVTPGNLLLPLLLIGAMLVTSALHLWLGLRRPGSIGWPLALYAVEVAMVTWVIATPNPAATAALPVQAPFRFAWKEFLVVLVALTAFSYRPQFVVGVGLLAAGAWAAWTAWILARPDTVTFADLPADPTREQLFSLMADPHFFDASARYAEILAILLTAGLIAGAVWRARRVVRVQAALERDRERDRQEAAFVRETFGRYVPESVARVLIADHGALVPEVRTATILFCDIEGFTALAERLPPDRLVAVLNAYFEAIAGALMAAGGVINQFQGDAVLATFNVPVADPDHAAHAVRAATTIARLVQAQDFAGERLKVRIGINTGEVVAGAFGARSRLNYTVHGDAVNVAARLEQMNKTLGTRILLTEQTWTLLDPGHEALADCARVGTLSVRGKSAPVSLYALACVE
ncbi:adenylate/guanylate cyclase domain-containing protein [Zavarzinia sp. CC-PAN008]|uniref:adenylate/guanylate cyclase domain-containing protein n=1 Tax=Zavarzinia sp. CC-PAN008 TaxID=3243332 RepID=UPI003F746D70